MYTETVKVSGENIGVIVDLIRNNMKTLTFNPTEEVYIFMSEKYYFRNNGQLMNCLIVTIEDENDCIIDIVNGGGATGLFGGDLGVEKSSENNVGGNLYI